MLVDRRGLLAGCRDQSTPRSRKPQNELCSSSGRATTTLHSYAHTRCGPGGAVDAIHPLPAGDHLAVYPGMRSQKHQARQRRACQYPAHACQQRRQRRRRRVCGCDHGTGLSQQQRPHNNNALDSSDTPNCTQVEASHDEGVLLKLLQTALTLFQSFQDVTEDQVR